MTVTRWRITVMALWLQQGYNRLQRNMDLFDLWLWKMGGGGTSRHFHLSFFATISPDFSSRHFGRALLLLVASRGWWRERGALSTCSQINHKQYQLLPPPNARLPCLTSQQSVDTHIAFAFADQRTLVSNTETCGHDISNT